ncbi:hypothetical protein MMC25_001011 [Agyrium rufum]|nr:hypothetical protein [Agyrium rufum]
MSTQKENTCDLLIIGAGPAGLMSATWASRCGIKTRIIDKRGSKIFNGQADGLQCRSLEIFESFGFVDRVLKECNPLEEISFWNPDENGRIRRTDRLPDTIPGLSRYQESVLQQGRIERFFLDSIKQHSDIRVERGVLPEELEIDESQVEDPEAYPVKLRLRHLIEEEATPAQQGSNVPDGLFRSSLAKDDTDDILKRSKDQGGEIEILHAKYVIGCDGAHSWTRRSLGFSMEGEQTDYIWGVLDIIPITDFPDVRDRTAIHSADSGSMMIIPRENKMVRLYIQLTDIGQAGQQVDRSKLSPEIILKAAQKIIQPYKITYEYCDWWTGYQIGQRVGNRFSAHERVFLAGDAIHSHSPKAGQGMNVSMQDAYNLGWKIGAVINGHAKRSILKTYQSERRRIAQELIAFDHKFSRLFSGRPARDAADEAGISMDEFKSVFEKGALFAAGLSVDYGASILVAKPGDSAEQGDGSDVVPKVNGHTERVVGKQDLVTRIKLGMRLPSHQVLNHSSGYPTEFSTLLISNGRFRIVLFAGNVLQEKQKTRVDTFCKSLSADSSFLGRFTPSPKEKLDSIIEIITIHTADRKKIELLDFPDLLHPFDKKLGWDYDKIFADNESYHHGHGKAYENYGVDSERGCVVVLRPDQYVGWIGELEDVEDMDRYFSEILIPQD